jgi:hypothetical protein
VSLVLATAFWLAIALAVPLILWQAFQVIKEYRAHKKPQSGAADAVREGPASADRREDQRTAEAHRRIRSLTPTSAILLAMFAAILGVGIGWFSARSWDLPEVRLARDFERTNRTYLACEATATQLFRARQISARSANPLQTGTASGFEALWTEAGREVERAAFLNSRCQREMAELDAMWLAIKLAADRQR